VRIIIELDGEVAFHEERIAGPDRVFVDLSPARAAASLIDQTLRFNSDADVVRQIRLGRHENRTTRVVLDAGGVSTYSVYALYNPYRLVIDCVRGKPAPPDPVLPLLASRHLSPLWGRPLPSATSHNAALLRSAVASAQVVTPPVNATGQPVSPGLPQPPTIKSADLPGVQAVIVRAAPPPPPAPRLLVAKPLAQPWIRTPLAGVPPRSTAAIREAVASLPPPPEPASPLGPGTVAPEELPRNNPDRRDRSSERSKAPEKNLTGGFSIARQLGLGVSRIVIDPGHGGHDPGAAGKDVSEAELVLDVSLRLEKLLQKVPGMEVVLTRRTDDFVSLQERTAIANRERADLFLSIHANASDSPFARGVETLPQLREQPPGAAGWPPARTPPPARRWPSLPDLVKMIALNNNWTSRAIWRRSFNCDDRASSRRQQVVEDLEGQTGAVRGPHRRRHAERPRRSVLRHQHSGCQAAALAGVSAAHRRGARQRRPEVSDVAQRVSRPSRPSRAQTCAPRFVIPIAI
jgi:N-acetylmuramoyl-L-alanine amidase